MSPFTNQQENMAQRVGTKHGNICLSGRTSNEVEALRAVGKKMEQKFKAIGIHAKACIPHARDPKLKTKRLVFELEGHHPEEILNFLRKDFDLLENGVIKIISIPLSFFLEKEGDPMDSFRSLVDETSFRINSDGNLIISCTCKEEDVSAARELFKEAGLEVQDKAKKRYEPKPGFVAIIKIADLNNKSKRKALRVVKPTPVIAPDPKPVQQTLMTEPLMDLVRTLSLAYLHENAGTEEERINLAKAILLEHIGLFDKGDAKALPFTKDEILAVKPI